MTGPVRLDLEVTTRCKYKCGICSVRAQDNTDPYNELTLENIQNLVQEFSDLGGREISITGGEPLERGLDFIIKLISFCKNLGLYVRMYTAGYRFSDLEDVISLRNAGLDCAYVSLEGSREIDEAYKGVKGSYEAAIRAIKMFMEVGVNVAIHFTPIKLNFRELPYVVEVAKRLHVKKIRIMAYVQQGRGWDNRFIYSLNNKEKEIFNLVLRDLLATEQGINLQFSGFFGMEATGNPYCVLEKKRFVITSDRLIIPSFAHRLYQDSHVPNKNFILGEIGKTNLEKIWSSSSMSTEHEAQVGCGSCFACRKDA